MEDAKKILKEVRYATRLDALNTSKCICAAIAACLAGKHKGYTTEVVQEYYHYAIYEQENILRLKLSGVFPEKELLFPEWRRFIFVISRQYHRSDGTWKYIKGKRPYEIRRYLWELYKSEMNCPDIPRKFFTRYYG